MIPCVPDDIEEFWDEIRPTREPTATSCKEDVVEEARRELARRSAILEDVRRIGPRRVSFDPTERRMLQGGDLVTGVLRVSRDTIDALEQARSVSRAIRPTEVSGRGRDPRVRDVQRALAVLGFPSQVSLTIDGDGSRSLTITPDPEEFDVAASGPNIHITQGSRAGRR